MNTNLKRELDLLNLQNIVTIIYILSLLISIYITRNDIKRLKNNTYNNTIVLSIFNRTLVVILTLIFLYISLENKNLARKKQKQLNLFNLQVSASFISLVSTLIVLYVVIKSTGENYTVISGISNPNL